MIHLSKVSYSYQNSMFPAFDSVSLDISKGSYVSILGANGSGKSTLARCITSLLHPQEGTIHIGSGKHSEPIGMVFQVPSDQIIGETAELDVAFGPENLGIRRDQMVERVAHSLTYFSLSELSKKKTVLFSTGQKQLLSLSGVHALNPSLLVLDEPTSMLSSHLRTSLLDYLDAFHSTGGTILHITHDIEEALRAQRIIVLKNGKIVFDNSHTVFKSVPIETLFEWSLAGSPSDIPLSAQKTIHSDDRDDDVVDAASSAEVALPSKMAILRCENLRCGPISDLSFNCEMGSITAVIGESGSGKSLLLELLAALQMPSSGKIQYASGASFSLAVQESEASLFEEFVADDVAFGPKNNGIRGSLLVERVKSAMEIVALPFEIFADRRTFSLSGGEKRKAALAGILAMDCSVILLDEPLSALDQKSRFQLQLCLQKLAKEGKTIIFTTSREEETSIADSVVVLPSPSVLSFTDEDDTKEISDRDRGLSRDQRLLKKLRKGSHGSWVSGNTFFHNLPPFHKYVLLISALVLSLIIPQPLFLIAFIVIEFFMMLLARYPLRVLGKRVLIILPWLLVLFFVQSVFFPHTSDALLFILRFFALLLPLSLFLHISSNTEIMYGIEDILKPLSFFKIPIRDISLVTGIVFRFIPILYEESSRITAARIVRGISNNRRKGLFATLKAATSLFVPLMMRTLMRAEHLSEAIFARYYGKEKNSRYLHWQTKPSHFILLIVVPLFVAGYYVLSLR